MKYLGKEIKKITEPQIFANPKKMFVWCDRDTCPTTRNVCAILNVSCGMPYRVIDDCGWFWEFCGEIEEIQPRRATYIEFSRWLSQGNGQVHTDSNGGKLDTAILYDDKRDYEPVRDGLEARKWGDTEWHEPTIDYLGIKEG
jgi:hypothetical protein